MLRTCQRIRGLKCKARNLVEDITITEGINMVRGTKTKNGLERDQILKGTTIVGKAERITLG